MYFREDLVAGRRHAEENPPPFRVYLPGHRSPFERWLDEVLRVDPIGAPPLVAELFGEEGVISDAMNEIETMAEARQEIRNRELMRAQAHDYGWVGLEPEAGERRTPYDILREERCRRFRAHLRSQLRREVEQRARMEYNRRAMAIQEMAEAAERPEVERPTCVYTLESIDSAGAVVRTLSGDEVEIVFEVNLGAVRCVDLCRWAHRNRGFRGRQNQLRLLVGDTIGEKDQLVISVGALHGRR